MSELDNQNSGAVETLYQGRFLALRREGRWEYVERINNARGAAFIVAVTDARELVLVEQYRVPLRAVSVELPAGIIGDEAAFANEGVEAAALRELEEETGFRGSHAELLASGPVGPGLTSEILYLIRAHGLQRVHAGGGVEGEDITVHVVPLEGVAGWLAQQERSGKWIEPRIYAALWFAQQPARPAGA
ncbi:MAG: NUDIX hydrolase [Nevskia sp.]|nr:NUDIX hydrolase [Nevskia sp.]